MPGSVESLDSVHASYQALLTHSQLEKVFRPQNNQMPVFVGYKNCLSLRGRLSQGACTDASCASQGFNQVQCSSRIMHACANANVRVQWVQR
jgi:hypothetical protein